MSPLQIEILLHYKWSAVDFRNGDFKAPPAVRQSIDWFRDEVHMLERNEPRQHGPDDMRAYRLTDRGLFFVEYICALPLPECTWVMKYDLALKDS